MSNHVEIPIPLFVFSTVKQHVEEEFCSLSDKQKHKLSTRLIELWFFIFEAHRKHSKYHEENAPQSRSWHVNINSKNFSNFKIVVQGTRFTHYDLLDILEKLDLIVVNHRYSSGKFSKSYKPSDTIQWSRHTYLKMNISVFRDAKPMSTMIEEHPEKYHPLIRSMFNCHLMLDPLFKWIDDNRGKAYTKKRDKYNKPKIMTDDKAYAFKIEAVKFNLGIFYFSVAPTGRVTSSIVTLPTFMLNYLRMNGKPLVEIDAKNSQPLLMSSILRDNKKYRDSVEAGKFYEALQASIQEVEGKHVSRDEAKVNYAFKRIFFSDKKMKGIITKVVDNAFGDGTSNHINQYLGEQGEDADKLWFKLQSLEADIWINSVATKSAYPVLTRHDSILCFDRHDEHFKESLVREYGKRGMKVSLDVQELTPLREQEEI